MPTSGRSNEFFDPTQTSLTSYTLRESIEQYWDKKLFHGPFYVSAPLIIANCYFRLCLEQEEKLDRSIGHCPTRTVIDNPLLRYIHRQSFKWGSLLHFACNPMYYVKFIRKTYSRYMKRCIAIKNSSQLDSELVLSTLDGQ